MIRPIIRCLHNTSKQSINQSINKLVFPPIHLTHEITNLPIIDSLPCQSSADQSIIKFDVWPKNSSLNDQSSINPQSIDGAPINHSIDPLSNDRAIIHSVDRSKPSISLAISGGVDSAVSAFLLKEAGFDVHCVYMHNWDELDELGHCTGEKDQIDAMNVANMLKLPFTRVDFVREYWQLVFEDLLTGYQAGFTPNPDLMCNREIKFQSLIQQIKQMTNIDLLATGHYARTQRVSVNLSNRPMDEEDIDQFDRDVSQFDTDEPEFDGKIDSNASLNRILRSLSPDEFIHQSTSAAINSIRLTTARDPIKDQTYFLSLIRGNSLSRVLFPLGNLLKSQTRSIARLAGLNVATKSDSMGICMIGRRDFGSFLSNYITLTPGLIRTLDGRVIGKHQGCELVTIGQSPQIGGQSHRWYVSAKNSITGEVTVVNDRLHPALIFDTVFVSKWNWLSGKPPRLIREQGTIDAFCKLRSTERLRRCRVTIVQETDTDFPRLKFIEMATKASVIHNTSSDLGDGFLYRVTFLDCPHSAVSPGQTLTLYLRGVCLGGGPVAATGPSYLQQGRKFSVDDYYWALRQQTSRIREKPPSIAESSN